jgi:hypothetical protein
LAVGDDGQHLHGRPKQAHRPRRVQVTLHRGGHLSGRHQLEVVTVAQDGEPEQQILQQVRALA